MTQATAQVPKEVQELATMTPGDLKAMSLAKFIKELEEVNEGYESNQYIKSERADFVYLILRLREIARPLVSAYNVTRSPQYKIVLD